MNPPCLWCGGTGFVYETCGDPDCCEYEEPCEDCEGTGVALDPPDED